MGPEADGWLIGEKVFDLVTWDVHGTAGDATSTSRRTSPRPPISRAISAAQHGVFNLSTELSLPFDLGPSALLRTSTGNGVLHRIGRHSDGPIGVLYGGVGVRAQHVAVLAATPDVLSELFNLDGSVSQDRFTKNSSTPSRRPNGRVASRSSTGSTTTPPTRRLRDICYRQVLLNPSNADFLTHSPARRSADLAMPPAHRQPDRHRSTPSRSSSSASSSGCRPARLRGQRARRRLDDAERRHVASSRRPTATTSAALAGILEYDWVWNIGDRTALVSNGWADPVSGGPRAFNVGGYLGPDRQHDLLPRLSADRSAQEPGDPRQRVLRASGKYRLSLYTTWDFGTDVQSYAMGITRVGTDMSTTVSLGFNSVTRTTSVNFEIVPNLLRSQIKSGGGVGLLGQH